MITATHNSPPALSRPTNIAVWTLQVATAALLVFGAYSKLSSDPLTVAAFEHIGAGQWLRYFVGFAEAAGAIGLVVPILSGLASLGLVALLVGATIITAAQNPISYVTLPAGTLLVVALIAWARRASIGSLFRRLSRKS